MAHSGNLKPGKSPFFFIPPAGVKHVWVIGITVGLLILDLAGKTPIVSHPA